jgi:hypothetical protein
MASSVGTNFGENEKLTTALIVYVIYKEMKIRKRQTANSTFTFAQALCDGPDH